jgi:membrane dipeptidase
LDDWIAASPAAVRSPLLLEIAKTEFNTTRLSWPALHRARVDLVCSAHFNPFDEWLSMPTDPSPEAPGNTLRMMAMLEKQLNGPAAPYAELARTPAELRRLLAVPREDEAYRVAVVHALEGGHALGGDLTALEEFARRGVAYITITHFFDKGMASAPNAYPFFPDANSQWPHRGLSHFGREVVREMERLGIMVDATHMTAAALADLLRVAREPFVATHASARTLGDHAYSFYDEHIQEIARRRGMIGVILYPHVLSNYGDEKAARRHGSLRDVISTIRHIAKICGTHKPIGIGSDFGGYISGPREMTCLGQIELLRRALYDDFRDHDVVEDIMAGNTLNFILEHWGKSGEAPCRG